MPYLWAIITRREKIEKILPRILLVLPITIAPAHNQPSVYEVQGVEVPVGRQVGQETEGGAVGLSEESLDMSARVPGQTPGHYQHRPVVVTEDLNHLLLLLAGGDEARKAEQLQYN